MVSVPDDSSEAPTSTAQRGRLLRELKDGLEAIIEYSHDAIITCDFDGVITSWNRGAEEMLGYRAEEVVGLRLPYVPTELRAEVEEKIRCAAGGEAVTNWESLRRHKEGHLVYVQSTLSPILNPEGEVVGVLGILKDISRRKKLEEALLRSREELAQQLKVLKCLYNLRLIGRQGREEMLRSAVAALGELFDCRADLVLLSPEDNYTILGSYHHPERPSEPRRPPRSPEDSGVFSATPPAKAYLGAPLVDQNGNRIGLLNLLDDRDRRFTPADQETLRLFAQWLSVEIEVAHAESRRRRTEKFESIGYMIEGLRKVPSERMPDLLRRFRQPGELVLEKVDLSELGREALGRAGAKLDPELGFGAIAVTAALESGLPAVRCDRELILEVLLSLIENAAIELRELRRSDPDFHPTLRLESRAGAGAVTLRLVDNGRGVEPDRCDEVFEPFASASKHRVGLGLTVAGHIVNVLHQGDLRVEVYPGGGSAFTLELPAA